MKLAFLPLIALILMGSGCGSNPYVELSNAVRNDPVADEGSIPNVQQIEAAQNGKLSCPFSGECSPAVALVSVATGKGVNRCTGFLIGPNRILTNDHCLKGNPDLEKDCSKYVFIHFADQLNRTCSKVIHRSNSSRIENPDYALIELNEPLADRTPLKISKRGFRNREKAVIYRVQMTKDASSGSYDGIQTRMECEASYKTLMNVNVNSPFAPVMTFGDCSIMNGNSGSPILNSFGEVAAINQGYLSIKNEVFIEQLKSYLLDGSYGQTALGAQTRCMSELVGEEAKACEKVRPILAQFPQDYLKKFNEFTLSNLPSIFSRLTWTEYASGLKNQRSFVTLPKCIGSKDYQIKHFTFTSSIMSYREGFNSKLQGEWRSLFRMGEKQTVFTMIPLQDESVTPQKKPPMITFESSDAGKVTIPACL